MQLLEDSIRKFKAELRTLTGADSSSTARRKKSRAVWKETKEAAKKTVNTELLKEMGLESKVAFLSLLQLNRRPSTMRATPTL